MPPMRSSTRQRRPKVAVAQVVALARHVDGERSVTQTNLVGGDFGRG